MGFQVRSVAGLVVRSAARSKVRLSVAFLVRLL
jgi:hypothetical protein